jgi:hypothetical protein
MQYIFAIYNNQGARAFVRKTSSIVSIMLVIRVVYTSLFDRYQNVTINTLLKTPRLNRGFPTYIEDAQHPSRLTINLFRGTISALYR